MSRKDAAADVSMEHRLQQVDTRWVRVVVWIFTPFLRWYYRVEAEGLENIEKSPGGALFVANHNAGYVLDILALAYIVKPWRHTERKIVGMGRGGPHPAQAASRLFAVALFSEIRLP